MWHPPDGHQIPVVKIPPLRSGMHIVGKVIRHARNIKNIHEEKLLCPDCRMFPERPVTGSCGHTRCSMCIRRNGVCPCGVLQPQSLHNNILVRDLIDKMMSRLSFARFGGLSSINSLTADDSDHSLIPCILSGRIRKYTQRSRVHRRQSKMYSSPTWLKDISLLRRSTSPQMRFQYARELVSAGRYRDSVAHLAQVAASSEPSAKVARDFLVQVIAFLSPMFYSHRFIRSLYRCVRRQSATAWIDSASLECPVCYSVMAQPVTTTCGHTFCRSCIKRTLQNRNTCPLCSSSLDNFYLPQNENTEFVCAILGTIAKEPQIESYYIPIFVCTVAFPDIPCPLMIFDNDFRNVIQGGPGSPRFGMLAALGDDTYANYGTIVEVRDCVMFEDGKSILSTVGISRFSVIEKITINGCPYARIQEHGDIVPMSDVTIFFLQLLAQQIILKVENWLPSLDIALRTDIITCFGPIPEMSIEGEWWLNPNGPTWLWWLIAILPLRTEIQMLMLSTKTLAKRMAAILRTLDAIEYCVS